jgi:hypothetical protein
MKVSVKIFLFLGLYFSGYAGVMAQPVPTTEFPFKMTVDQYVEKYSRNSP